jgi:hypothetical protein
MTENSTSHKNSRKKTNLNSVENIKKWLNSATTAGQTL